MRSLILDLLEKKGDLPPFPEIIMKLQKIVQDPDAGIIDVVNLIKMDPALAGSIIKLASSALYSKGFKGDKTLMSSVQKLGLNNIKQIVFSVELSRLFTKSRSIDSKSFWRHSVAVALVTQRLSHYIEISNQVQETAYLAGLMHDIGIMVFSYLVPDAYVEFLVNAQKEEKPLHVLENEAFGIDHQELGALFVKKWWHLKEDIINSIEYHHFPFKGTSDEIQCQQLVNVANGMCNIHGITNGIDIYQELFREGAWEGLGLSLADAESMIKDVNLSIDQAYEMLSI